jgi:hypothetical protein
MSEVINLIHHISKHALYLVSKFLLYNFALCEDRLFDTFCITVFLFLLVRLCF